ncbi:uncharacterized protein BYT42DRAFT_576131 [Radiomyces spectabilis]|uniref:uncharacterized protein n=1 Tax=Radiomyces spectabilis TaxID=64574 RepID=UPI00221E9A71|nr:uncharacterized protein BYT42DRAFT_576131 [Radiomyces spectabilis]KAI8374374.1 hypothetical protein BYT42DRAFT_576131 [Radiomyces spectabilis]
MEQAPSTDREKETNAVTDPVSAKEPVNDTVESTATTNVEADTVNDAAEAKEEPSTNADNTPPKETAHPAETSIPTAGSTRPPPPPPSVSPHGSPMMVLPPGWTEHVAPTGQPYWHNSFTGQSSWVRPPPVPFVPMPPRPMPPFMPVAQGAPVASVPSVAPVLKKQKQKKKKIPGTNWLFVLLEDGHEFYYDRDTKKSVWEMPEELAEPMEQLRKKEEEEAEAQKKRKLEEQEEEAAQGETKRQKSNGAAEAQEAGEATEMTEEDIMWQLQNMAPEEIAELGIDVPGDQDAAEAKAEETVAKDSQTAVAPAPAVPDISEEERVEQYTQMLAEVDIDPFSTWEKELPKFVGDKRFALVTSSSKRKNLFNNFCRVAAQRIKAQSATAKSPEEDYEDLLEEKATATMYWEDFRRKVKDDRRFKAIRDPKIRQAMFKDYIKDLRKRHDKPKRKEDAYMDLLHETKEIRIGMRWRDAKLILEKDPRYRAIESRTLREDLFRDYLEDLEDEKRHKHHRHS